MPWNIIAAIILIIIGFNLLAFAYMKRRIASVKAEGYRRQAEEQGRDNSATASASVGYTDSSTPYQSSDYCGTGSDSSSWSDGGGGDCGGDSDGGGGGD